MIAIKDKAAVGKMTEAGRLLADIFDNMGDVVQSGCTTLALDHWIEIELHKRNLASKTKGYMGYKHVSCLSVNDEVVHGVPCVSRILRTGDVLKVDICASWQGYCADMARVFFIGEVDGRVRHLVQVAEQALKKGIAKAVPGNRVSDISAAIQQEVESHGFGVVRDFAGHGIGKHMHEDPEILNYGHPGRGPVLKAGMALAIEPMITMGKYHVYIARDGWTVKTQDKSLAAHVEDTVIVTEGEPSVITRSSRQSEVVPYGATRP